MTISRLLEEGLTGMDDASIRQFPSSQGTGVLGLPTAESPYLLPMSYSFDGESTLYFTFVGGPKAGGALIARTDSARFLVYDARTAFNRESVMLSGPIEPVPQGEWDRFAAATETPWRPDIFEAATAERR